MRRPDAVLFDFGNTLLHCQRADYTGATVDLFNMAHNPRGIGLDEFACWLTDIRGEIDRLRLASCLEVPIASFQSLLYERFGMSFDLSPLDLAWEFYSRAETMAPAPVLGETLAALRQQNLRLGVVSNFMLPADIIRRELARYQLDHHFEFLIASSAYGIRKPHPALFRLAAGKFDLPPDRIWFVGDSLECDIAGARNAGMTAVWYNLHNLPAPTPPDPTPHLTIHSLWDLTSHLRQWWE